MDTHLRLRFQKGDVVAIALVLVLAVAVAMIYIPRDTSGDAVVEIYQNGTLLHSLSLNEDDNICVEGNYTNVIAIRSGSVSMIESNCPGEDCVHSGSIRNSGRSIVCLPNGVEVRIVNAESEVDFVVG